jgi:hypothetical protein
LDLAQIDPNKIMAGDLNTPLSPTGRSSRQKNNKESSKLNNSINQM